MTEQTTEVTADTGIEHLIAEAPAETEVVEQAEEVTTESAPEEKPEEKRKEHTTVSHAALYEERQLRKEEARLRKEAEERAQKYEQTLQKALERINPQAEEVDIATKLENEQKSLKDKLDAIESQSEQQKQFGAFVSKYKGSVEAYKLDQPDYTEAFNHLYSSRKAELSVLISDPAEVERVAQQEEINIVNEAYRLGKNPGEIFYAMAKQRGYAQKADAEPRIDRVEKGLNAARSLGSGGAKPESTSFSLDNLASLSDEEFNRVFAEAEKKARR